MIRYIYSRHLCRKAIARAFHGRIMAGKSPLAGFPVRIEIAPHTELPTLLTCARKKRDAHPKDDNACDCRKQLRHIEGAYAFTVPFEPNKEAGA